MNKKILLPIIIIFFYSCGSEIKQPSFVENIELSKTLQEKQQKVPLSSIATKIEYISLETSEASLLDKISTPHEQVQFMNDRIYIHDKRKLLSFNFDGSFVGQIGAKGNGPGEYLEIRDFSLLLSENQIAIFSPMNQKAFIYDLNGEFQKSVSVPFWPLHISYINNHLLFANPKGRRDLSEFHTLTSIDKKNGTIGKRLLSRKYERGEKIALSSNQSLYKIEDELHFWEFQYDTIWTVSNNLKLKPKYFINYENKLPYKYLLEDHVAKFQEKEDYIILERYVESSRYLFFRFANFKLLSHIFYDKRNGQSYNLRYDKKSSLGFNFAFYNDIDGGLPFWPQGIISENKLFMIVHGYELKEYLKKHKIDKNNTLLYKISQNYSISDNPMLMVVTLKQ